MSRLDAVILNGISGALASSTITVPVGGLAFLGVILKSPILVVAAVAWLAPTLLITLCRPELWRRMRQNRSCRPPVLPGELDLFDPAAGRGLRRLRYARRERELLVAELPRLTAVTREIRLRTSIAELEAGCTELILAIDRIGRSLDEHEERDRQCPELESLRGSKAALETQLSSILALLERVALWFLLLDVQDQTRRTGQLQESIETLAAALDSERTAAAESRLPA